MEGRVKLEPWRVCRPVVADSHHFDEEQDPNTHLKEKMNPDPHFMTLIRNLAGKCEPPLDSPDQNRGGE